MTGLPGPALSALIATQIFHGLKPAEIGSVIQLGKVTPLAKDGELFHTDDPSDSFYILLEGALQVRDNQGSLAEVPLFGVVGEVGAFTGHPRTASVVALADSKLIRIPSDQLLTLCESDTAVGFKLYRNVTRIMAQYLRNNTALLEFFALLGTRE